MNESRALKVLYILGMTRSGSTILENILGNVPGFFAAGEIHWLWRSLVADVPCGCGSAIRECPVWSPILHQVSLEVGPLDAEEIIKWQLDEERLIHTPRLLRLTGWPTTGRATLDRLMSLHESTYRAIASVTETRVLVDSSKSPAALEVVRHVANIDMAVVHLVRDPRAVAYSWRRGTPAGDDRDSFAPGPVNASIRWLATSILGERVRSRLSPGRTSVLRYEDFVEAPEEVVRNLVLLAGETPEHVPFVSPRVASLIPNHTVSGNRSRWAVGNVEIREDDEWRFRDGLRSAEVAALTYPLLRRYGYRLRRR